MIYSKEHIILFDGVCNMCNGIVQFIIKRDKPAKFKFASLQSQAGQHLLSVAGLPLQNFDSFVYFREGKIYTESTAALLVFKDMEGMYHWLHHLLLIPAWFRNKVYRLIAKSRYSIWGKRTQCMIPTPAIKSRFLDDTIL